MRKPRKKVALALFLVVVAIGASAWIGRPTWRETTAAEIASTVDPLLRGPLRFPVDQEERSKALADLVQSAPLQMTGWTRVSAEQRRRMKEWLTASEPRIARQLAPGPAHATYSVETSEGKRTRRDLAYGYPVQLFPQWADAADYRFSTIRLILRCAKGDLESVKRLSDVISASKEQMWADTALCEAIDKGTLDDAQARQLLDELFRVDAVVASFQRGALGDFSHLAMYSVLNPIIPHPPEQGPREKIGNYDALESARKIARVYVEALRNLELPPARQKQSALSAARLDWIALPEDDSGGYAGYRRSFEITRYRWAMALRSNSFGNRYIVHPAVEHVTQMIPAWEVDIRTAHQLVAIKLAAFAYRERTGKAVSDLNDLVKAGYFPSIPIDPWSGQPILFDPKRRVVSSSGHDRTIGESSLMEFNPTTHRMGLAFRLE